MIYPALDSAYLEGGFVDEYILEDESDLDAALRLHPEIEPTLFRLAVDVVDRFQNVLSKGCPT